MRQGLCADEVSLTNAARSLHEAAEAFEQLTDMLIASVAGGARSPWGDGVVGMVMDQVNEKLGQACRQVHTNLGKIGVSLESMRDNYIDADCAATSAIPAMHRDTDLRAERYQSNSASS